MIQSYSTVTEHSLSKCVTELTCCPPLLPWWLGAPPTCSLIKGWLRICESCRRSAGCCVRGKTEGTVVPVSNQQIQNEPVSPLPFWVGRWWGLVLLGISLWEIERAVAHKLVIGTLPFADSSQLLSWTILDNKLQRSRGACRGTWWTTVWRSLRGGGAWEWGYTLAGQTRHWQLCSVYSSPHQSACRMVRSDTLCTDKQIVTRVLTSNGGCPTRRVYSMHPRDQTSDSSPWGPRVATSLDKQNTSVT